MKHKKHNKPFSGMDLESFEKKLMEIVKSNPGIGSGKIAMMLGVHNMTIQRFLEDMATKGILRSRNLNSEGKSKRMIYYINEQHSKNTKEDN